MKSYSEIRSTKGWKIQHQVWKKWSVFLFYSMAFIFLKTREIKQPALVDTNQRDQMVSNYLSLQFVLSNGNHSALFWVSTKHWSHISLSSETKTSYTEMEVVKACQQPILWFDSSSVKKKEVHKDKLWVTSLANIQIIMFIKKQYIQGCKIFDPLGLIASPDPEIPVIQTSSIWYPYLMVKTCCYANNLYVVTRHSRSNSWIYTDNSVMDFF